MTILNKFKIKESINKLDHLDLSFFKDLGIILNNILGDVKINNKKFLITFSELYSVYSMSKAEDSELTLKEAKSIQKEELNKFAKLIKKEVSQLDKKNKSYNSNIKKLYNKLEFANILSTYRIINEDSFKEKIKKEGITKEILIIIHQNLTNGLDDIFKDKGLKNYHLYKSGEFRNDNNTKVGKHKPLDYELLNKHLNIINELSLKITSINDVFKLHGYIYGCHYFNNGNKRVSRLIENVLLSNLGLNEIINPNIGYHYQKGNYIKNIVDYAVGKRNYDKNIDLGKSSILLSSLYILSRLLKQIKTSFIKTNGRNLEIFELLTNGDKIKTSKLYYLYNKKNKISEAGFYKKLNKNLINNEKLIKKEKIGKNIYYSLSIKDEKYIYIKDLFLTLLGEYKKYNPSYNQISFLNYFKD